MKDLWKTTSIKKKPGKDRFRRRELPETTGEEGEQRRHHSSEFKRQKWSSQQDRGALTSCRPWALTRTAHSISGMQRRRNAQTANAPVRIIWRFYRTERPPRHVLQKLADSRLRVKKLNTKTLQLWSLMKPLFTVQILFSLIMTSICSAFRIFLTRTIWGVLLRFFGGGFY